MKITMKYLLAKTVAQVVTMTALMFMFMSDADSSGLTRFDWLVG